MALLFRPRESPERADASRRIAALARAALALSEDDAVTVSEIACGDPECGGAETVILVMRKGRRTEAVKVKKAMALASDEEIAAALRGI